MRKRFVMMSSDFSEVIFHDVMAGYNDLFEIKDWEESRKTRQHDAVKIDMKRFKSIWGLMLGM